MYKKVKLYLVILSATILTVLFHRQYLGLNLLIFEFILFTWLIISKQFRFIGRNQVTCGIALLFTSVFSVLTYSDFSLTMNFIALFIFIGVLVYPEAKSLLNSIWLSFANVVYSQVRFFRECAESDFKGHKPLRSVWKSRIFVLPVILILIFILIYRASNPVFDKLAGNVSTFIGQNLNALFRDFDFLIITTFFVSLLVSSFFLLRTPDPHIIESDLSSTEELRRLKRKRKRNFKLIDLRNEYRAAVFLLMVLNAVLLILNSIDVYWVWFNFEWQGQYLKQFVHEGTYLLILSIIISIILVLYFFRNNLNFYDRNKFLKYLSYAWLAQNAILTVSVAIRNFHYIDYFALAYKRIGVILFLLLTVYGLYTVLVKVLRRRSAFYLFKANIYALFVILIASSVINWDIIIAKYNFKHADKAFLHLDFLATLSDKALPYLDKSLPELLQIDTLQKEKFPFEVKYMTPEAYRSRIEHRKELFKKKWESKNFLSWNLPEYLAYRKLFDEKYISLNHDLPLP